MTPEARSRIMSAICKRNTKPELSWNSPESSKTAFGYWRSADGDRKIYTTRHTALAPNRFRDIWRE